MVGGGALDRRVVIAEEVQVEREDFARTANQEFDVTVGSATMTMTLISIEPHGPGRGGPREGFCLVFKSASPVVLPQTTYRMRNRTLDGARPVDVFMVPIARDADGVRYQAVFN